MVVLDDNVSSYVLSHLSTDHAAIRSLYVNNQQHMNTEYSIQLG